MTEDKYEVIHKRMKVQGKTTRWSNDAVLVVGLEMKIFGWMPPLLIE